MQISQLENHKVIRFLSLTLILSIFTFCNKEKNGAFRFNDFNFNKLKPINDFNGNNYWYGEAFYEKNKLRSLKFFTSRNDSVLRNDTVMYEGDNFYIVTKEKVNYYSTELELIKLFFINENGFQSFFLIKKDNKCYLLSVVEQVGLFEFSHRGVNTNMYCIEFNDIHQFIKHIKFYSKRKFYYQDYITYEIKYNNNILFYREIDHNNWGIGKGIDWDIMKDSYSNLYLDLTKIIRFNYLIYPFLKNCTL